MKREKIMNNIYIVYTDKAFPCYQETIADYPRYEYEKIIEMVIAQTPSKAKSMLLRRNLYNYVEFMDLKVKKVGEIYAVPRVLENSWHARWDKYSEKFWTWKDRRDNNSLSITGNVPDSYLG